MKDICEGNELQSNYVILTQTMQCLLYDMNFIDEVFQYSFCVFVLYEKGMCVH